MIIGIELGIFMAAIGTAFVFGVSYAFLIRFSREKGHMDPYTAFAVSFGVLITLIINKLIHNPEPAYDFILELCTFGASGIPMIVEYMLHHSQGVAADLADQVNGETNG